MPVGQKNRLVDDAVWAKDKLVENATWAKDKLVENAVWAKDAIAHAIISDQPQKKVVRIEENK